MAVALDAADLAFEAVRLLCSVAFLVVAAAILRREVSVEARRAQEAFAVWWAGLALVGVLSIPHGLGVPIAGAGLAATRFYLYLLFGLVLVSIGALSVYIGYVYTGRMHVPFAAVYVLAMLAYLVYLVEAHRPVVEHIDGVASLAYVHPQPVWAVLLFGVLLVLPMLIGALAYCGLFFRVPDEQARLRIVVVGFGLLLWFAHGLTATVLSFFVELDPGARLIGQALGVAAAAVALWAFLPAARRTGATTA